jgi:methylase of polypeptide subunit release factors
MAPQAIEDTSTEILANDPALCVEVGSGPGCVLTYLGTVVGPKAWCSVALPRLSMMTSVVLCRFMAIDVNPDANQQTERTLAKHQVSPPGSHIPLMPSFAAGHYVWGGSNRFVYRAED